MSGSPSREREQRQDKGCFVKNSWVGVARDLIPIRILEAGKMMWKERSFNCFFGAEPEKMRPQINFWA